MSYEYTVSKQSDNCPVFKTGGSKPIFWEKYDKYFKMISADFSTQHAKVLKCLCIVIQTEVYMFNILDQFPV